MFFALVANDRATFERLLDWTRANLAGGQFDAQNVRLPAWQWGRKPDGSFGVLDPNSASDSDLWIAYDLLQAGRLWKEPAYTKLGQALAAQIVKQEVVDLPGLGPMLLPGPQGFRKLAASRGSTRAIFRFRYCARSRVKYTMGTTDATAPVPRATNPPRTPTSS